MKWMEGKRNKKGRRDVEKENVKDKKIEQERLRLAR